MLVFPDMFLFRKIAAVYMAFSERNVIFAGAINSYWKDGEFCGGLNFGVFCLDFVVLLLSFFHMVTVIQINTL